MSFIDYLAQRQLNGGLRAIVENGTAVGMKEHVIEQLFDDYDDKNRREKCFERFKDYIVDDKGNYKIGGAGIMAFIDAVNMIIEMQRKNRNETDEDETEEF